MPHLILSSWLLLCFFLTGHAQELSPIALTTQDLFLPEQCLVQYERISLAPDQRAENFRFYVAREGDYYRQDNDRDSLVSSLWDRPYSDTPTVVVNRTGRQRLQEAIDGLDVPALLMQYGSDAFSTNQALFERWTICQAGEAVEVFLVPATTHVPALSRLKRLFGEVIDGR